MMSASFALDLCHEDLIKVSDIATRDVVALAPRQSLGEGAAVMMTRRISSIVIVDGANHPIGILTERDMVRAMQGGVAPETWLETVMSAPVISVPQEMACQEAYLLCLREGVRHLVLVDGTGHLAGVVSETDFRLHMNLAALAGRRQVSAIMTRSVLSLPPEAGLRQAIALMEDHQDNALVVVEGSRPLGIITERDVVRLYSDATGAADPELRDVMAAPVITVRMDTTASEAASRMLDARVRHLVVTDPAGELAGLISEHDLTQNMALGVIDTRLDAERAFLRALIDTIPDLVWLKDPDGVYLACNRRFERLFGVPEEAILGRTDYDFVDRELADSFRANDRKAIAAGGPSVNEEWVQFADDGHREHWETIKTPMRDAGGRLIGVLGIGRDITQARQAQQALKESREKLRILIEAIPDSVQFKDSEGRWLAYNHTAALALGLENVDCLGRNDLELAQLAAPQYRDALMNCWRTDRDALHAEHIIHIEEVMPQPDGNDLYFEVTKIPLRNADGNPTGLVILARDVTRSRHTTRALQQSLQDFNELVARIPVGVFKYRTLAEGGNRFDYVSPRWCEMVGITAQAAYQDAEAAFRLAHPDDQADFQAAMEAAIRLMGPFEWEGRLINPHGVRWLHIAATPIVLDNGDIQWDGIQYDITERKQADNELRLAASVFTGTHEGIVITDAESRIVEVNEAFTRITGYTRDAVLGRNPSLLKSGHQDAEFYRGMWQSLADSDHWSGEVWNRRQDGSVYAEHLTISAVRDDHGKVSHYVGIFADITPLKEHERRLEKIAHYDALTGVPNRVLLADRMAQAIAQSQRAGTLMAVCYLDLDGFKPVNDTHGHAVGDRLLIEMARRMKSCLRGGDTIARIGGDEFVLLLQGLRRMEECETALARLLDAIAQPVEIDGHRVSVSASLGVTLYPDDQADADTLLRHADQAMYKAKESGKNRFHLFDPEHDRQVKAHLKQLQRLSLALARDEFELHYQPTVDMTTGRVLGMEALIRWDHPEQGLLPPAEFLPAIKNSELEIALGEWVLDNAIRQCAVWRESGLDLRVSVNIGASHLLQEKFAERLNAILLRHPNMGPDRLELEILESTAITDVEQASKTLSACRKLGVRFALDDFGTGYSSLTYFRRLPVDTLKIDQSFVLGMLDDPEDLGIVESVVQLAQAFNRCVIAEGVETREHGAVLSRLRCHAGQGFGLARPMRPETVPGWITEWQQQQRWLDFAEIPLPRQSRDIVLKSAIESHRKWIENLSGHLHAPEWHLAPPLHSHQCRFGVWYHGSGSVRYGHLAEFAALEPLHEDIHKLAAELTTLADKGRQAEALDRLPELHARRDHFVAAIQNLIENLGKTTEPA